MSAAMQSLRSVASGLASGDECVAQQVIMLVEVLQTLKAPPAIVADFRYEAFANILLHTSSSHEAWDPYVSRRDGTAGCLEGVCPSASAPRDFVE